jgi:hypothetical protein
MGKSTCLAEMHLRKQVMRMNVIEGQSCNAMIRAA